MRAFPRTYVVVGVGVQKGAFMLAKTYAKKIKGGNAYRGFLLVIHFVLWLAVAAAGALYLLGKQEKVAIEMLEKIPGPAELVMTVDIALFFLLLWAWKRLLSASYVYAVTNAGAALYVGKPYQRFTPSAISVKVGNEEKADLTWFCDVMMQKAAKARMRVRAGSIAIFAKCDVPAKKPAVAPVDAPAPQAPAAPVAVAPKEPVEPEILVIIREAEEKDATRTVAPAPAPVAEQVVAPAPVVVETPAVVEPAPAADGDDDAEEEESEVREVTVDGRTFQMVIRYSRSFTARVTQADDTLKAYYSEIKNELLSYDVVKSRISWKHDAFNRGRLQLAKLVVRGKNLCVYLALDPNAYEVEKYHQVDQGSKNAYAKVPMMVRVKSDLGLRKAKFLISEMMANYEIEKGDVEAVDYASQYVYKDTKTLIAENLIKELQGGEI